MSPATAAVGAPVDAPLPLAFFRRPTEELAVDLLGVRLVRRWASGAVSSGLIVEVEAYGGPQDRASHARSGPTRRNATMFGPGGRAYLYRVYGLHTCLNVVGAADGAIGAVLVRAVVPEQGIEALAIRRTTVGRRAPEPERSASGPGNVAAAFGLTVAEDGLDLTTGEKCWLTAPADDERATLLGLGVVCGPRIGVAYAGSPWTEQPWRFGVRGHPALSRPFPPGG